MSPAILELERPHAVGIKRRSDDTVSLAEAADYLERTPEEVIDLTKVRLLASVQQGGERRIRYRDLIAYRRRFEELREEERNCPLSRIWDEPRVQELYLPELNSRR